VIAEARRGTFRGKNYAWAHIQMSCVYSN
jgi:hypothetical protein